MMREWCWFVTLVCFALQWQHGHGRKEASCQQVCESLGVSDGCQYAPKEVPREEVIVVTNGTSNMDTWKWDTITMVVSAYFSSVRSTGRTACYAHSMGRRYGLRESVPADIPKVISDTETVKSEFAEMIVTYQRLLMADHIVYDLLDFFVSLKSDVGLNKSAGLTKMAEVLSYTTERVRSAHDREVYCIVPWQPPCESDCGDVRALLSHCHVLMMSPDSYLPEAPADKPCLAQATVPISQFLYGIDRYISLRATPYAGGSIVAGIPWHGYVYKCAQPISDDKCVIRKHPGEVCFDNKNRQRMSLSDIHMSSIPGSQVKMDVITKGVYYNLNESAQLWFENFTTLLIKYQLVQDLYLRGLSLWSGEDLTVGMTVEKVKFSVTSWNFLTHNVLHKAVYSPHRVDHYYADTVAGVGVGCMLLGTLLGVIFTCIGFRHSHMHKLNRPFKLDEDESAFRDDEGL